MTTAAARLLDDTPREADVERYLLAQVTRLGGECLKNLSRPGALDRLLLLPGGDLVFVEVKRLGEKPNKLQQRFIARVQALGFRALVVDSREAVDAMLRTQMGRTWN